MGHEFKLDYGIHTTYCTKCGVISIFRGKPQHVPEYCVTEKPHEVGVTLFFGEKPICPYCESVGSLVTPDKEDKEALLDLKKIRCVYCDNNISPEQYKEALNNRRISILKGE